MSLSVSSPSDCSAAVGVSSAARTPSTLNAPRMRSATVASLLHLFRLLVFGLLFLLWLFRDLRRGGWAVAPVGSELGQFLFGVHQLRLGREKTVSVQLL